MLPDWLFMLIVYWCLWFLFFLKFGVKDDQEFDIVIAFFVFLMVGFVPLVILYQWLRGDKS